MGHGFEQFPGEQSHRVGVADILEQDDELIAAQPGQGIGRAQQGTQSCGDAAQQTVAELMSQGVVDVLEVVEVDEQQRQLLLFPGGAMDGVLEAIVEEQAVGKVGQAGRGGPGAGAPPPPGVVRSGRL